MSAKNCLTDTVEKMAAAFIVCPLPDSVCADLCATRQGPGRIGTNLLSFEEAKTMFAAITAAVPVATEPRPADLPATPANCFGRCIMSFTQDGARTPTRS